MSDLILKKIFQRLVVHFRCDSHEIRLINDDNIIYQNKITNL